MRDFRDRCGLARSIDSNHQNHSRLGIRKIERPTLALERLGDSVADDPQNILLMHLASAILIVDRILDLRRHARPHIGPDQDRIKIR